MCTNLYIDRIFKNKEKEFLSNGKDVKLEVLCYGLLALQGLLTLPKVYYALDIQIG